MLTTKARTRVSSLSTTSTPARRARVHPAALLGLALAAAFLFATRTEGFRANWGDPWSDGNALTSGRYFARDGFAATGMTPVLDVGPLTPDSLRYTHYPPLPDLVNGVQQRVVGTMSIGGFRLLADLLSLLSLVFFYRFVRRFTSAAVAGYAVLLVGTNLLWLQYADTLHHVPLYTALGYAALDQVGAWTERPTRRRLAVILIATTLCALASYDFGLYLPIMTVAAVGWSGRRLRDRESWPVMMAVGAGLILGVVVKFALIAWAVGPVHLVHDLLFQFEERATARHSTNYTAGLMPIVSARLWRFFTPLFLVLLLAGPWLAWRRRRTSVDAPVALRPLWFLAAGVPFCVVFSQLLVEQFHPTLQFVPFYAVGFAAIIVAMREHARPALRRGGLVLAAFLLAWQARELVRVPKVVLAESDLRAVGGHLAQVDDRRFVLSNFLVDGPVRYYWQRHLMGLPAMSEAAADAYFRDLFWRYGNRPVRFVAISGAPDVAYDKLVFALLAGQRRWSWIASPYANRAKIRRRLGQMNDDLMEAIEARGTLEFERGPFRVYRIDPAIGDRGWALPITDDVAMVELGDPQAVRYKLYGLGPATIGPDGVAAAALTGHEVADVRFTMQGLVDVPAGRDPRGAVQLHVPGADAVIAVAVWSAGEGQLRVQVNGVDLGEQRLVAGWQQVTYAVTPAAVEAARRVVGAPGAPDVVALIAGTELRVARVSAAVR